MPAHLADSAMPFAGLGELASLGAALLWAGSICAFRRCGDGMPSSVINLWKSLVATFCLAVVLAFRRPEVPAAGGAWWMLAASGIVGLAIGDTFFFASLKRLGAQSCSVIQCLSPPFAALIAWLTLEEMLSIRQVVGLTIAVIAVLGIVSFGRRGRTHIADLSAGLLWSGITFGVLSALCQAVGVVLARDAFQGFDVVLGTTVRFVPAIVVLIALQFARKGLPAPPRTWFRSRGQLLALSAAAFAGTFLGVLCLSIGTKYAKAGVVTAISTTYPVWIVPVAWIFLGERPGWSGMVFTPIAALGIALMCLAAN
jgi:drug/metabolite transporter (DMT)-like permease